MNYYQSGKHVEFSSALMSAFGSGVTNLQNILRYIFDFKACCFLHSFVCVELAFVSGVACLQYKSTEIHFKFFQGCFIMYVYRMIRF